MCALVNAVTNLWIPQNLGNFLTRWGTNGFSEKTLLHGACFVMYILYIQHYTLIQLISTEYDLEYKGSNISNQYLVSYPWASVVLCWMCIKFKLKETDFLLTLCTFCEQGEVIRILHFHMRLASQFIVLEHLKQANHLVWFSFELDHDYTIHCCLQNYILVLRFCGLCIISKSSFWCMAGEHYETVLFQFTVQLPTSGRIKLNEYNADNNVYWNAEQF